MASPLNRTAPRQDADESEQKNGIVMIRFGVRGVTGSARNAVRRNRHVKWNARARISGDWPRSCT